MLFVKRQRFFIKSCRFWSFGWLVVLLFGRLVGGDGGRTSNCQKEKNKKDASLSKSMKKAQKFFIKYSDQ